MVKSDGRKVVGAARSFKKGLYDDLKEKILTGELKPLEPLRQEEIANRFGVSKIPVREALRRLEADGLVEFKPRCGAFVVELTEADVLEMLDIRIALESRALELSIPNMTDSDLSLAESILREYEKVDDVEQWSDLNSRFHWCIYAPCGLPKMLGMIRSVKERTGSFMRLKVTMAAGFERPHGEHMEILNACRQGNVDNGVRLLREHIEKTKKEVAAYFRSETLGIYQNKISLN